MHFQAKGLRSLAGQLPQHSGKARGHRPGCSRHGTRNNAVRPVNRPTGRFSVFIQILQTQGNDMGTDRSVLPRLTTAAEILHIGQPFPQLQPRIHRSCPSLNHPTKDRIHPFHRHHFPRFPKGSPLLHGPPAPDLQEHLFR